MKIIIATSSINRKTILKKLFPKIIFKASGYNEKSYKIYLLPRSLAKKNSKRKAMSIDEKDSIIIGFDTVIYKNFKIYHKPNNITEARETLKSLSGKWHTVVTGTTIIYRKKTYKFTVKSRVKFYKLTEDKINYYLSLNESIGRAGGYAVQGMAKQILIERYKGDYFNIVGVPIFLIRKYLMGMSDN